MYFGSMHAIKDILPVTHYFFHPHAGHGDQEYAVPCDRIRQERGNLW